MTLQKPCADESFLPATGRAVHMAVLGVRGALFFVRMWNRLIFGERVGTVHFGR
jgi:hypothetical protein